MTNLDQSQLSNLPNDVSEPIYSCHLSFSLSDLSGGVGIVNRTLNTRLIGELGTVNSIRVHGTWVNKYLGKNGTRGKFFYYLLVIIPAHARGFF